MSVRIYQPWGGLGDNLQFSTIPELCHTQGEKCFISDENAYRNKNIKQFIWDTNPFISEQSICSEPYRDATWISLKNKNVIECHEHGSGFEITNHYPKIYYTPKSLSEFKDKVLVDIKSVSIDWQFQDRIYERVKDMKNDVIVIKNNFTFSKDYSLFDRFDSLFVEDLFMYSDIINSARAIYTVTSGISVLAPAIKYKMNTDLDINVFTTEQYSPKYWDCGYWFNNVNYIVN